MEKQKTTVRVAGKDYALVSTDSPEHLNRVAESDGRDRLPISWSIAVRASGILTNLR